MAVLEELEAEVATENRPALPGMVGGVSRGAVGRRRKKKRNALDEVTEEIAAEPESERPMGALEQVKLETEADPENVRRMRAEGKRLTDEQQKIAFKAERERPLTDVLIWAAKEYYPAVWNTIGRVAKGTAKFAVEGVGKPLGNAVLSGLMYEPGSDEQEKAMRDSLGGSYDATRSLASGVAQDIEETSNVAIRAGMFGTSITDLAAEKFGLITEEQAFNNYLSREGMRRSEAEDAQAYPDRASTLLARNPLAGVMFNSISLLRGQGDLTPEVKQALVKDYEQTMLQQASEFKPDEDLSLLGEILSPTGLPSMAVMPLTKALGGAMEATGGAAVRAVTKPTIGGVNPLEGVGIGIRKVGEGAEAVGAKFSEAITGRPDTFLASPATVVSAFTKRPGQLVEGSGKFLRDVGRQIDAGGIRGRTGIIERLGRDPNSSAWVQDLFGAGSQKRLDNLARKNKKRIEAGKEAYKPGRGGIMRAKTADYGLRMANSLNKTGVSGSVLNGILGAADIETAEEFGRSIGVGRGIGISMGVRVPERIGAVLDPTLNLRSKIDRVVETDPLDRRLDEEADLKRFRATADPELVRRAETIASPDELIASQLKELDGLFQLKAESEYAEEDTTELDGRITSMVDGINRLREQTKNLSQADLDERRRMVELDIADNLDILRSNHSVAGLNNVDVNLLRGDEMAGWLRDKWGQTLERAEAVVGQFDGVADLSDAENQTLMLAKETVNAFNAELLAMTGSSTTAPTRGVAFDPRESVAAHLVRANVTVPTIVINADAAMKDPRGFRHTMLHEGNHALRQFQEVREMQQPMYEFLFGRKAGIPDDAGNRQEITPGIITDEFIDNILTPLYFGGAPTMNFENVEARREYIRDEVVSEVSGISEGGARTIREVLDSPGQAVVDRLLISKQNSILGRLRAALELAGVELDSLGNVKSVLFGQSVSNATMPEVLAMMRQFKRQQLEYTDTMVFASKEMRENVEIGLTELMTNRALQEAYKDDVNWQHEVILDVRDENGDSVVQIPLPESPVTDAAVGEYRIVNGQLVDENGTVLPLDSSVNLAGLPDNSKASVENRIARNVDGSPKIIQQKEIEARARQRDQMIKDAIDNAPDDGSPTRLRDTGNGYYVGIPSPSQLSAIRELPNTLVTPYVKKNLLEFIKVMQRRDGTRILMEYQPALKKGKYRALSPKIRDVVPIGFRFTKAGNWLAVNVSVSRMFEKLDLWARNKPENLDLWGRSPARFMDDVLRVLDNHNNNLAAQTNLDVDPDIAMQKKNRVNDFFNMFTKDTEAANPSRTKLKARRGQESADRILMSARIDRINQMQISNAQKFPVDYGKMKINFLPGQPNGELRLDPSEDLEVENDLGFDVGPGARFLPGIRYTDLPDDPKKLMADFYLLNAMLTTLPTGWSMGKSYLGESKGGEDTMFTPVADPTGRYAGVRAEKYQDALDEAKQTLIPALHSKIQKAIYFAIGAEFRHIYDQVRTDTIPQDLVDSPFFQEYAKGLAVQGSSLFGLKKDPAPRRYKGEDKGYLTSYVAMENARKKLGMSLADVARFAERMYREPQWNSHYGGEKWGDIAAHLAKMSEPSYSAERVRAVVTGEDGRMQIVETDEFRDPNAYEEMFKEIDRGYDLQHNTNTVFNKIKKYSLGSEGYGWIAEMLDFKANVGNPRELQRYVSGTMRRLSNVWFGDMRADAPLTQDLEESVKAQLPETFKTEAMGPQEFIGRLADLVGTYYRKSGSGVRVDKPFTNIANTAQGIHQKLGRGSKAWKAIEKDQNAHIGLILEDNFGDLDVAKTDAVKLFRMLLNEGKDPRVTGKPAKRTPLNVPKSDKGASMPTPAPSGTAISPGDLLSVDKIKTTADKIVANWDTKAMGSFVDILGHRFYLAATSTNPGFADLTVRKKYPGESTYGPPTIIKTILMSNSSAKQVANAIQEFQDWLGTAPAEYSKSGGVAKTPSGQWFIGNVFQPKLDKSTPSNLNEFVTGLLFNGFNGLKLGDVTVVLAGGSGKATTFKVYQGDSVSESNLLTVATIPGGKKRDIVDWFAGFAEMQAKKQGYLTAADWMQQNLKMMLETNPMPTMPPDVKKLVDMFNPKTSDEIYAYISNLEDDLEFVDSPEFENNVPPSDIKQAQKFLAKQFGIGSDPQFDLWNEKMALAKYLHDLGKWASDKLEKRKSAGMTEEFDYKGLTPDSPAAGYPNPDGTLMTIAEAATTVGPFEMGSGENHVYFTTNDGTAITNPYEDETSDSIVLPNEIAKDADIAKGQIMNFWSYQGIGPSEVETALAIFDAANPGHLYSKQASAFSSMDSIMEKANELGVLVYDVTNEGDIILGDEDDGVTIKKNGPQSNDYTFEGDSQNFAIGDLDTVFKAAAKYLKQKGLEGMDKKDDAAAQKQAMEFLDQMLFEDPIELGGNTWELAVVEEDNGDIAAAFVKLNGVVVSNPIPFDPSTATPEVGNKAIYDDFFALDWMKDWKAPEARSLLTPEQDKMMLAADELVAALSGGYISQPEVMVGGKNFSAKINEQGNMVVFGQDESGNITGAIPITGSKNMDPIDLEAAVYEALDLLSAGAFDAVKAPAAKKPTQDEINEAADGLLNAGDGDSVTVGGYEFQTVLGGQGGASVNILPEGTRDIIDTFYYDGSDFDNPSDLLDVLNINISQFFNNLPGQGPAAPGAKYMPAWSADQLAERPEITAVPEEFDERPLRPRFVYRLESIENDPRRHELTDADGFTFFTTSPESAAALALNFAYDGYRPTSENFSVYRYRLPENADIQRDHTLFNLDKMTSGQERVAAVKNAHDAMGLPLDAYRYVPAGEVAGTSGKRIDFPENSDLMKIYRAIRRGGTAGGVQFMPAGDTSRLIDIEDVRPFKVPRPVRISKNRWRVGDVITSKEPDADAAAMIAGLQRLARHSMGVDNRKALSSVFVTLRDNPYFKRLLAMSQENLKDKGMDELYRGVGVDENRSQLTRHAKSFTQFYDMADMVAEANAEDRRGLEPEVLRISPVGKFPVIEDGAMNDIAEELGVDRSRQPHMPGRHMEGAFGEGEVFVAPSSARPNVRFMPGGGITPKTLYNFYHLATLESQGRIKSEYGQGLMREYLNIYKQRYLETLAPLVSDQIKKYIGRGRVDEPVTEESLSAAANDPVALDELMRQTYRSDMRRRNDVWNNITEHLKGLAAAGTTRDIIFRIDRLNNAIHNTNELLFSKFKNAGELMDAFEAINDARDERAYARNVDKDLRQIEEFEGGPGARFMPREVSGEMAWRGTYFNDERYHGGEYGGGNYEEWRKNPFLKAFQKLGTTQVTYLAKDKELAYDFAQKTKEQSYYGEPRLKKLRAEKFKIRGKSTRLFDPMDAEDREKVAKVLKKKRIPEDFAKRALKETTVVHRYDGNWKPIEMLAPAIKEAGFDGYIALENPEEETYGLFGDLVGREDSMATPIRANSSGKNVKFMPGNASGDQAMAGSSQVDPGLAEVTAPSVDGGPLSGARFMPGMFGITARAFSRPKKVVVPNQKRLDDLKKRLPEYEVDVSEPDGDSVVMVKLFLPGTGKKRKEIGFAKLHLEPYNEEGDSIEDSIRILMTIVGPNYRNKGYGEALYREIAKVAQKYKKEFLYSDEVSTKAAKVRLKLFKEPKYANLLEPGEMLSLVGPRARYMPAARRKKQKEIEFVRPRTFGGPFVEIDGTEPNLDSSTRLDMEDAVMMRKPKNRKAPSANLVGYPMAAAMLVDGKIYSGVNHLDAVFRAANNGAFGDQFKDVWETHFDFSDDFYDEDSDFNVVWNKMANRSVKKGGSQIFVDGFVTDKGYYVSRDVATKLERKNPDSEFDESGEDELHGGHLSGHFMPGYNPRYTDDNGNFDRDAWLNDRRRAEAELRRRGVYKSDLSEEDYENEVRALLREMR